MEDAKKLYETLFNASNLDPILQDLRSICETYFDKLDSTFRQFFSALPLRHRSHDHHTRSLPPPHPRLPSIVEDLSLLLRCSLLLLTLPHPDQKFLLLKCRYILRVLKFFLAVDVAELRCLRFRNFLSDSDLELSDSCAPFLCALLEVFADELLRHLSLRRYLMTADSASSIHGKLFVCHSNQSDIASVLEVISTHFILSVSNEEVFDDFTSRLFLHCDKDFRFHGLSLVPSVILLLDPVMFSAPKMFQAHVISMVSETIGSGLSSEILAPDMNFHLTVLQRSVNLYCMHVSSLQIDGFRVDLKGSYISYLLESGHPTFESYIQQSTRKILNQVLSKSDKFWDSYQCKISSKTKADLLAKYIAFMKERRYIFVDSCRDVASSILDCIINQAFSPNATGDALCNIKENISSQDICLLASILKLMSVSLLQTINCLSNTGGSDCLKTMGSTSVREKYDFLISIIDRFQQFNFCLPIQTFLDDNVMKSLQSNCKVSKLMFVHFIGLLSLSFCNELDLLAKGCISVLVSLMYLFVFEEGDLVALGSLMGLSLRPGSSENPSDKSGKGTKDKQSVYKVAAEFRRIQACNLRTDSFTSYDLVEDGTEKTCNGEMFLNCVLENPKSVSDYDELVDFLECKTEKNYSKWWDDRQTYRKRRNQKKVDLRKNKKEAFLKFPKSIRFGKSLKRQKNFTFLKHRKR